MGPRACGSRVESLPVNQGDTQWENLSDYYAGSFPSRAQFARRDSGCSSVGGPYAESIAIFECPWMNMPMFEYPWCDASHEN